MQSDTTTSLALIAILGTVITALFKLLAANTKALNALVKETKDGNQQAETRNGHLGEQNVHIVKMVESQGKTLSSIDKSNTQMAKIISKSALIAAEDRDLLINPSQHVETQVVDKQVIKGR